MKIGEVCKKTELSERAVRLYVEKGLLKPESRYLNGRTTLEFSQDDVEILKDISTLRKNGFSIADIIAMQNSTDDVCDIVKKRYSELEREQIFREGLIQKLKEISKRGNIPWRKVSNILLKTKQNYTEQSICVPLEDMEPYESDKKSVKDIIKRIAKVAAIACVVALIIFVFVYENHNKKILTCNFSVYDVIVDGKWKRGDEYYVSVRSLKQDGDTGAFFKAPRTVQVGTREYYEAFHLDSKSYDSFEIWIEMSYADAKAEEVLDEDGNISIEKVLSVDRLARDYCFIRYIDNK